MSMQYIFGSKTFVNSRFAYSIGSRYSRMDQVKLVEGGF